MSNLADLELVAPAGAEAEVAALGLGGPHRRFRVPLWAAESQGGDLRLGPGGRDELEIDEVAHAVRTRGSSTTVSTSMIRFAISTQTERTRSSACVSG